MCCAGGTFTLAPLSAPQVLFDLFLNRHELSDHFRTYVRTYNNSFAFSTLGVKYDLSLCTNEHNLYVFRVNDTIHHFINSLIPPTPTHRNLQLYYYDPTCETSARLSNNPVMEEALVQLLIQLSHENPYAQFFRQLYTMSSLNNYRIFLKTSTQHDQRVYNLPRVNDVSIIWQDGNSDIPDFCRDIQIYPIDGTTKKVSYYSFAYDPVQYPLIHPFGQPGWHSGILKRSGRLSSTTGQEAATLTPNDLSSETDVPSTSQPMEQSMYFQLAYVPLNLCSIFHLKCSFQEQNSGGWTNHMFLLENTMHLDFKFVLLIPI